MKNIIIVGAGFAGLEAAGVLSGKIGKNGSFRTVVIDRKANSDFLPILPDVVSGRINPGNAQLNIGEYLAALGVEFINDEAASINLNQRSILLASGKALDYEYLILAVGSETNFYNREDLRQLVYKIDDVNDALRLRKAIQEELKSSILIIGGGYTGIEVATNISALVGLKATELNLFVVDIAKDILGPLPEWMKSYVRNNLINCKVRVFNGISLVSYDGNTAVLSDGMKIKEALVVWAAGVKAPAIISSLNVPCDRQGRIIVDKFLNFHDKEYAVGDCAAFNVKGVPIRMAVQFSIYQARVAAMNITREIANREKRQYYPLDMGFLVPMANKLACGMVLGIKITGFIGWLMHWFMCIYRTRRLSSKIGIIMDLFSTRRLKCRNGH